MNTNKPIHHKQTKRYSALFLSIWAVLILTIPAFGHGGKTHADNAFTSFQALQKATELFDRLVVSGKLEETWETELVTVGISIREKANEKEKVVSFKKASGTPDTVYIFFTAEGKYSGSNFTGE
jgi:Family of unknown function (DUF6488)